ncbi:MAG: site-specific integrase [Lachnospiraceae bacterium]|nr:site-specific integrase [Lachnospiraceae bacterium]
MKFDSNLQNYVDWKVTSVTRIKEKYGYRVMLIYNDGQTKIQQKSGFPTQKKAQEDRDNTVASLVNGNYVVYANVRLEDFLEFWLENDLGTRSDSYNTMLNFGGIIRNHIVPVIGRKKMSDITRADIQNLYNDIAAIYRSTAKSVKTIINISMRYAISKKIIAVNPAEGVDLPKLKNGNAAGYHKRFINTEKTLNLDQILLLIEKSKGTPIYMQVLFNVLMGLRRSEIIAVKYDDIDYINRTLKIKRQLGKVKGSKKSDYAPKTLTKQEIKPKTESGIRDVPIPDYVFEAIQKERARYEKNRRRRPREFQDLGYICCSTYGRPRSKDFHWKYYKKLLSDNGLPDIRWHDLRATFCTLLLKNDINPKAVAKLMGHSKEIVTLDVYADKRRIITDGISEMEAFMEEVLPKEKLQQEFADEIRGIVVDISEYIA